MGKKPKGKEEDIKESKKERIKETTKEDSLELAMAQIEKQYGEGSIMTLGSYKDTDPVTHVSTGSLQFDIVLGKGGWVFGRAVELYGPPGGGKSTLCLETISNAQKLGLKCAFIDREQGLDADYAESLGVDVNELIISQPDSGEQALSIIETLIRSGVVDVIILDSLAACSPKADMEKQLDDNAKMAGRAALLTRFFDRNLEPIAKNKVLLICTNQVRANITGYGNPESTGGGYSAKHSVSQRIEIRPGAKNLQILGPSNEVLGVTTFAKTTKNRMAPPYKTAEFDIIYGKGIDRVKDIFTLACELGIVEKSGAWFMYDKYKIQGWPQLKEKCKEVPELLEEVRGKVLNIIGATWGPEGKN